MEQGIADPGVIELDLPSSLIAGEDSLARIYNANRSSSAPQGCNYLNTTLLVNFDEHGGTYDHIPPPAVPRPAPKAAPGQFDFTR